MAPTTSGQVWPVESSEKHPVTVDPPTVGAGRRRRPPRQDGLDTRHPGRWAPATVCSACPGRRWRDTRASRSRSAPAGGAVTAPNYGPKRPYAPARGQLGGPWLCALHASRRAFGVTGPSGSGGPVTRPVGGVSGPFRAALKTYRKFEQPPAASGVSRHGTCLTVASHQMLDMITVRLLDHVLLRQHEGLGAGIGTGGNVDRGTAVSGRAGGFGR
jgi:hypothetical protein